jgi:hypothetical protein
MRFFKPRTIWWPTWQCWILLCLLFAGLFFFVVFNVHDFLAVTSRVAGADILIVEAWVPESVVRAAADEFVKGSYRFLVVSNMHDVDNQNVEFQTNKELLVIDKLLSLGIAKDRIIECYAAGTDNRRSAAQARAAYDAIRGGGIKPKGINVIAPAAHARKTWVVYRKALSSEAPVGIVAVPTGDYDPARWWRTTAGVKWIIANGAAWLFEWINE